MNRFHASRHAGFTLIELMIAVVIVGILLMVALPTYSGKQASARRADAEAALMGFAQAMEQHYALNFSYLGAGVSGADTGAPADTVYPDQTPRSGTAFYNLTIQAATASTYTLRATPISSGPQADDGRIEINSLGQRFRDKNNDSDTGDTGENYW